MTAGETARAGARLHSKGTGVGTPTTGDENSKTSARLHSKGTGVGTPTTGDENSKPSARLRAALAGGVALVALIALQGTALAQGTSTNFSVQRVQSLPSGALTSPPFSLIGVNQVVSALNYPGSSELPGSPPVYFRPVNGTNEHSPLAFPG